MTGVLGLDDLVQAASADVAAGVAVGLVASRRPRPPRSRRWPGPPRRAPTPSRTRSSSGGLTDDQIANAYGAFGLYKQGDFGQGQHIAIFELEPFLATDIETFDTCYFGATEAAQMSGTDGNLAGSRLSVIPVDGGQLQPGPGSGTTRPTLDIEDVSAMAPEADIDVYEAPNTTFGGIDEYATIINSDTDQVVTSSWASCEQWLSRRRQAYRRRRTSCSSRPPLKARRCSSAAGDTGDDSCNRPVGLRPPRARTYFRCSTLPPSPTSSRSAARLSTTPPNPRASMSGTTGPTVGRWRRRDFRVLDHAQLAAASRLTASNATDVTNAEAFESATAASQAPFATPTFCDGTLGLPAGTPCREVPDVSAQADEFTGAVTIFGLVPRLRPPRRMGHDRRDLVATPIWAAMLALVNASKFCTADTVTLPTARCPTPASPAPSCTASPPMPPLTPPRSTTSPWATTTFTAWTTGSSSPPGPATTWPRGWAHPRSRARRAAPASPFTCASTAPTSPARSYEPEPDASGPLTGGDHVTVTGSGFETRLRAPPTWPASRSAAGRRQASPSSQHGRSQVTLPPAGTTTPPARPNPTQDGAGPADIIVTLTNGLSSAPGAASVFDFVDETSHGKVVPERDRSQPLRGPGHRHPATVTVLGSGFVSPGSADKVEFGGWPRRGDLRVAVRAHRDAAALRALTPATACPVDNGAAGQPLNAADDICQVEVTVTTTAGTSATAAPLAPYEGPLNFDSMGGRSCPPAATARTSPKPTSTTTSRRPPLPARRRPCSQPGHAWPASSAGPRPTR